MKHLILIALILMACNERPPSSDDTQRWAQEKILAEGTAQTGMPAIHNFRERKIVKDLYELRDMDGLVTYTYLFSSMQGKFVLLGQSVGYGIPAATQYTNPDKVTYAGATASVLSQADPNGLFSPSSAEGTWVMMLNPKTKKVEPQYIEERILVTTFKIPPALVLGGNELPPSVDAEP